MLSDGIEVALARMHQSIQDIKEDITEIKEEQKRVSEFVTTQKVGYWFLTTIIAALGAILVGFHEEVSKIIGLTKVPH
jgi:hypothetical protein